MKVKLIKDVEEGGCLKAVKRKGKWTAFLEGTVLGMSEESAKKYIEAGLAEEVKPSKEKKDESGGDSGSSRTAKPARSKHHH